MTTTTQGFNRSGVTDYTAGTFNPDYQYLQVVAFSDLLPGQLARKINIWHQDHPEFTIAKIHYSSAGDADHIEYSALIEIDRTAP